MATTQDWIDELKSITVLELAERIKALEEEYGVSATAVAAELLELRLQRADAAQEAAAGGRGGRLLDRHGGAPAGAREWWSRTVDIERTGPPPPRASGM
jgi:hypothetical protein